MTLSNLVDALMYFGALVGEPTKRSNLISKAIDFVDDRDAKIVISYCVERWEKVPGVGASYLLKSLAGPRKWQDLVNCAKTWQRYSRTGRMPDHYCLNGRIDPLCAHGRPANVSCPECNGYPA